MVEHDLAPGAKLRFAEHAVAAEKLRVFRVEQMRYAVRRGAVVAQPAARGLSHPCFFVAVAVEDDAAVLTDGALYELVQRALKVRRALQLVSIAAQHVRHGGVENDVRLGDRLR